MENLLISFNAIFPIFIMLALGYSLKLTKLIKQDTVDNMNTITFKMLLPILLFNNVYKTDIQTAFNAKLLIFAVGSIITLFILLMIFIPLIEKDNRKRGVLVQGIFRSNFVIFGLPISLALCGPDQIGPVSLLIAIIVPIYNALSVIALEIFKGNGVNFKRILKGVLTNPLIIGGALGLVAMILKVRFPAAIDTSINDLSKIATPLALLLLGATFSFSETRGYAKPLAIGVIGKLIVVPLIFIPLCIFMGFRGAELIGLMVMIGAPAAVSTYTVAAQMKADEVLAGQLVVYGSIGSVFSMFVWIFTLKQMGMF